MKIVYFLLLALMMVGCHKKPPAKQPKIPSIKAAKAMTHSIPIQISAVGHVTAYNSAEIKAQVEGVLVEVEFDQGKIMQQGELLCTIDPRPYQAQLEQNEAIYLQNEANFRFAKEKVERYTPLVQDEYVSQLDYDSYVTNVLALDAQVKQSLAEIELARVNLEYCYVRAPFTGLTSRRYVDEGNLITNAGQSLLLLNQIQPIYVDFSIPERELIKTLEHQHKGALTVHVQPQGCDLVFEGKVIVVGNQVNQKTGMVPIRAEFKNEKMLLWPGQFSKVHLILEVKPQAIMVPEQAVNLGQKGTYVVVVTQAGKSKIQPVVVGEQIGDLVEIVKGVASGDVVVTEGQINVRPDSPVDIRELDTTYIQKLDHESF